ncbi:hypothetical protein JW777_06445, partial [bacterium]|nr:hypothetical protein [bacterium]
SFPVVCVGSSRRRGDVNANRFIISASFRKIVIEGLAGKLDENKNFFRHCQEQTDVSGVPIHVFFHHHPTEPD